ncbi:MAG: hypothetical protein DWQ01_20950 [Planctomycetota bacterium]|nr:MAG: hypothetical protein DWQ01_20950 [Planctomycetota bacterium]
MSNRQTLYLLLVLAVLAGGARVYMKSYHDTYENAMQQGKNHMKFVHETVDDLQHRLESLSVAATEQGFRGHFQARAYKANMGRVGEITVAKPRRSRVANAQDQVIDIAFGDENQRFTRDQIRGFLYFSELLMPRVRTSALHLIPAQSVAGGRRPKLQTGEDREDAWAFKKLTFLHRSQVALE